RNDVLDNVINNFGQVNKDLNDLISGNRTNLDQTIANLQTIANVLAQHHSDLDRGLATLSAGLAPYTLISAYGQWFQIRVVYTCLAQQTTCTYEDPANPPKSLNNPPIIAGALSSSPASPTPSTVAPATLPPRQPTLGDIVKFVLSDGSTS
ncbi:MAG TPA: hypothetical protein VNY84_00595, partial [Acidimicrobiales bacterium]|nr:hypothetical protein [Acidimicrobiales bacterium]